MLLEDLNLILKVAEFKSITAAAESLNMRTATASAAIKRVERFLGVELFIRSTRHLRLSIAGEKYIPTCEKALQMLDLAHQNILEELDVIDGDLRLAVPSDLGRNIVLPWLDELTKKHKGVHLKLHISDSNIDFYRDPVDVALRYGPPEDSNLYGFKICDVPRVICASKKYLDTFGTPKHPNDLINHNGLLYRLHDLIYNDWEFTNNKEIIKVKMHSNSISNDGELVKRWCLAGKGLANKSCIDMSNELLSGQVISVLPMFTPKPTELWLVCPSRQLITPIIRLLRNDIKKRCMEILNLLNEKNNSQ